MQCMYIHVYIYIYTCIVLNMMQRLVTSDLPTSYNMFPLDLAEFARSSCIGSLVQPRGLASRESWCGSSSRLGPSVSIWSLQLELDDISPGNPWTSWGLYVFILFYIVLYCFIVFVESMGVWWNNVKYISPVWFWGIRSLVASRQLRNSSPLC